MVVKAEFDSPHGYMIEDYAQPKQTKKNKAPNDWIVELKYDGTRQFLIAGENRTELVNKRGTKKTRHFPDITEEITIPEGVVLDGETIVKDELHPHGNKNILQKRDGGTPVIRKSGKKNFKEKMKMKQYEATFVAFDIVRYKGESVKDMPIEKRRELLEDIVNGLPDCIETAQRFDSLDESWTEVTENKMEGLILKRPETKYPNGRTGKWKKVKNIKDTIISAKDYEKHSKGITVIGEDQYGEHRLTVNGHTHKKVKDAIDNKDKAEVEVSYLERTKNGSLREPTFKKLP